METQDKIFPGLILEEFRSYLRGMETWVIGREK